MVIIITCCFCSAGGAGLYVRTGLFFFFSIFLSAAKGVQKGWRVAARANLGLFLVFAVMKPHRVQSKDMPLLLMLPYAMSVEPAKDTHCVCMPLFAGQQREQLLSPIHRWTVCLRGVRVPPQHLAISQLSYTQVWRIPELNASWTSSNSITGKLVKNQSETLGERPCSECSIKPSRSSGVCWEPPVWWIFQKGFLQPLSLS